MRARASASATREVSIVIQRRPHCSATVGGGAGTAGRVEHEVAGVGGHEDAALNDFRAVSERHKSCLGSNPPDRVSSQMLLIGMTGKSSRNRTYRSAVPACDQVGLPVASARNPVMLSLPMCACPAAIGFVPANSNCEDRVPTWPSAMSDGLCRNTRRSGRSLADLSRLFVS